MEIPTPRPPPRLRYDSDGCLIDECLDWQDEYAEYCRAVADRYRAAVERFRADIAAIEMHGDVVVCPLGAPGYGALVFGSGEDQAPYTDDAVTALSREQALEIMGGV